MCKNVFYDLLYVTIYNQKAHFRLKEIIFYLNISSSAYQDKMTFLMKDQFLLIFTFHKKSMLLPLKLES